MHECVFNADIRLFSLYLDLYLISTKKKDDYN